MSEYPSYLIHYGIPGQKWYQRRFQNDDGTYTSEGLERRREQYGLNEKKINKLVKSYNKNPNKFGKEVRKIKDVKNFKKDNINERAYSAVTRKKHLTDVNSVTRATDVGELAIEAARIKKWGYFNPLRLDIEEENKIFEDAAKKYLESKEVKEKYSEIEKDLNNTYNSYIKSGEDFTNKILGKYGNIKLKDNETLSKKFMEEITKDKNGKSYKKPKEELEYRPNMHTVKLAYEVRKFQRKNGY